PRLPVTPHLALEPLLSTLSADPTWETDDFPHNPAMVAILTRLRIETLNSYGMDAVLLAAGHSRPERERLIGDMAKAWAQSFDARSLVVLLKAGLRFDVSARLNDIQADVLFAGASSDVLFPP